MIGRERKHSDKAGHQVFQKLWNILGSNFDLHPTSDTAAIMGWNTGILISVPETNGQKVLCIKSKLMVKGEWLNCYPTGARITIGDKKWMKLVWDEEQQEWLFDTKKLLSKVNDEIKRNQMIWRDWQHHLSRQTSNKARIAQSFGVEEVAVTMLSEYFARVSYTWGTVKVALVNEEYRIQDVNLNKHIGLTFDDGNIGRFAMALDEVLKGI